MPRYDEEPFEQQDALNRDAESIVERQPRSNISFTTIFFLFIVFVLFKYLSNNNVDVQVLIDTALTDKTSASSKNLNTPSGKTSIHQLISNGNIREIEKRILSIDKKTINQVVGGMTPIMLAASSGKVELIDLLFTQGADPNVRGSSQRTALQYATERNHIDAAKRLLSYGADIDAFDNGRLTPLIMAANRGYTELGLYYIEKGADVNIQLVKGWTALIDAAARNDTRLAKALLLAGADKELAANNGMKAIDYARQYEHEGMVKLLSK